MESEVPMKSPLTEAVKRLLEARNIQMVTSEEWDAVAAALKQETGEYIEWRTQDELPDKEPESTR